MSSTNSHEPAERAGVPGDQVARELAELLAKVSYDPDIARRIARRAGFPPEHLPEFKTALWFWSTIVEQAIHGRMGLDALVREAIRQFPYNSELWKYGRMDDGVPLLPIHASISRRPPVVDARIRIGLLSVTIVASCVAAWVLSWTSPHYTSYVPSTASSDDTSSGDATAAPPIDAVQAPGCETGIEIRIVVAPEKLDGTPWDADLSPPDVLGRIEVEWSDGATGMVRKSQSLRERQRFDVTAQFFRGTSIPFDARLTARLYDADYRYRDSIATFSDLPLTSLIQEPQKRGAARMSVSCL